MMRCLRVRAREVRRGEERDREMESQRGKKTERQKDTEAEKEGLAIEDQPGWKICRDMCVSENRINRIVRHPARLLEVDDDM